MVFAEDASIAHCKTVKQLQQLPMMLINKQTAKENLVNSRFHNITKWLYRLADS